VRLSETVRPISAYANGLDTAGAATPAAALRLVAAFLNEFGTLTTSDLVERVSKASPMSGTSGSFSSGEPTIADLLPQLEALERVLRAGCAETAADDLTSLLKLVGHHWCESPKSTSVTSMLNALKRVLKAEPSGGLTKTFIERLRKDTRTSAFEQTFEELAGSKLKREQVVEIARAVYGGIPKNTSRKAALKFIRKPHDAYMSAKRGIDAMGGRSAA
jgi:hypothetical protein